MYKILRWHISRLYQEERLTSDVYHFVEVTITMQAKDILEEAGVDSLAGLAEVLRDDLDWWMTDESQLIKGLTTELTFMRALTRKNVLEVHENPDNVLQHRKLEEDMVFLQYVDEEALKKELETLKKEEGLPVVSSLVKIDDAQWLDFTQQARKMSSIYYHRVLGEREEGDDALQ
jgi:predicted metal-dependent hydrolase